MNTPIFRPLLLVFFVTFFSACTTRYAATVDDKQLTQGISERNKQVGKLNNWQISGQIAFIQGKKRDSAAINWQVEQDKQALTKQRLDLTTAFGINILHLSSSNHQHTLEVNGKQYQTEDLNALIYSLTGLTLPTQALSYWLKGLVYQAQDKVEYDLKTQLPNLLTSRYGERDWLVRYHNYQLIGPNRLATGITISQAKLTIKIKINQWTLL
jgi:outer membrane lipoprotein LolB